MPCYSTIIYNFYWYMSLQPSYLNCIHDLAGYLPGVGMAARPKSVTELFEWFDSGYQEQVGLSSDVS